jgi:RNA polymerase sigma-70 factor (ECF subfamily)
MDGGLPTGGRSITRDEFAGLLRAHWSVLWAVATGVLGSRERASDALQEASLVGLGKLSGFTPGTSFVQWMSQIVRFTALNHARKHKRAVDLGTLAQGEGTVERGGDDRVSVIDSAAAKTEAVEGARAVVMSGRGLDVDADRAGLDDDLSRALGQISDEARTCLIMRVVLEMTYKEIAGSLGIPENTAMSHVHRARKQMHETLSASQGRDAAAKGGGDETADQSGIALSKPANGRDATNASERRASRTDHGAQS